MIEDAGGGRALARLAVRGAAALGARQLALAVVAALGGTLLARLLEPREFGVYAGVSVVLSFLLVFADGGLGTALIRQETEPTELDLRQVLTIQLGLVLVLGSALVGVAVLVDEPFGLRHDEVVLLPLVALALGVQVLQTVPLIQLERRLAFDRVGLVSVLEVGAFYGIAVLLAARGWGVRSVAVALVAQAVVGAAAAAIAWPWRPALSRHLTGAGSRVRYSALYQGSNLVSLAKDSVTPVLVGASAGAAAVGYVAWATMLATLALVLLAPLNRLYLPLFARLQHDSEGLARAVEGCVRVTNAVAAPAAVLVLALAAPLTDLVYGREWRPGLAVFGWLWLSNLVVPSAQPLFALLNAVGRSGTTFALSVMWMVLTWVLTPLLLLPLGLVGFGVANAVIQVSNVLLLREARRAVDVRLLGPVASAWLPAGLVGLVVWQVQRAHAITGTAGLVAALALGVLGYLLLTWPFQRHEVRGLLDVMRAA